MKYTFYLFTGLGADERAYMRLQFPQECNIVHIKWAKPDKNDTLADFAKKLLPQIDPNSNPVLFGLSLGGMIAIEVGHLIPDAKLILLATAKDKFEFSTIALFLRATRLHRIAKYVLKARDPKDPIFRIAVKVYADIFFGQLSPEDYEVIFEMSADMDIQFVQWALHAALFWENTQIIQNEMYHIHGTNDTMIPINYVHDCIRVEGGTHFMMLNRSQEISTIIADIMDGYYIPTRPSR